MRVGIIYPPQTLLDFKTIELLSSIENDATRNSLLLMQLSERSNGLSGRSLRKLPFLAHALYIQKSRCNLEQFVDAIKKTLDDKKAQII